MNNYLTIILIISILFSCKQKDEIDNRIIYQLPEKSSIKIMEVYLEEKRQSGDDFFYVIVSDTQNKNGESTFILNSCYNISRCIYSHELYPNTNRFLKLNDELYLPIFISIDLRFVEKKGLELPSKAGGGKIFTVDYYGDIINYGISL
jgi:hypothetical protein